MSWARVNLGDIAEFKNGLNFNKDQYGKGVKYISVADFKDFFSAKTEGLAELKEDFISAGYFLKEGDILFVRSNGNKELVGRNLFIENTLEPITFSGFCIRARFTQEDVLPKFYAYLFKSKFFRNTLSANAGGTNINNLNQGILSNLNIPKPPLPTQRRIASFLSAYDDLIENNLNRIKLLEEATRNTYKQFKKETIKDWVSGSFSDFFKINNGCAFKAEWYSESGVPIIRTRDYSYSKFLNVGQPIFIDDFQAENFSKFLLKEYDFMLIMVGASLGRYGIILPKDLPALQNQNQWALREVNKYGYLKVIKLLLIEEILETLLQQRTGAARDFFRASFLNELKVRVPSEKTGREINSILENSFNQINVLTKQNTKLREARDILLPRLMNGQIEV